MFEHEYVANRHLPTASDVASGGLGCIVFRTAANRGGGGSLSKCIQTTANCEDVLPQVRDTSVLPGKARPPAWFKDLKNVASGYLGCEYEFASKPWAAQSSNKWPIVSMGCFAAMPKHA